MSSILAIDCGNSYIKWGINSSNIWLSKHIIKNDEVDQLVYQWHDLENLNFIIVSNVSNEYICSRLKNIFNSLGFKPYWITSQTYQCGVVNKYNPDLLGCDRWAALIAAWNFYHASCLVVTIGTAMTVDVLSENGVFLGGYILPGPYLLKKSLVDYTQIETVEYADFQIFPTFTDSAIHSGIIISLIAFIEKIQQFFFIKEGYSIQHCILSGGGLNVIKPYIEFPFIEIDNIVLEGLLIIANDKFKTN